jgi:hypothetical protein
MYGLLYASRQPLTTVTKLSPYMALSWGDPPCSLILILMPIEADFGQTE